MGAVRHRSVWARRWRAIGDFGGAQLVGKRRTGCNLTRDNGLQLFPLDAGLAAVVELRRQPGVDRLEAQVVLGDLPAEALADHEHQPRQSAVLGQ